MHHRAYLPFFADHDNHLPAFPSPRAWLGFVKSPDGRNQHFVEQDKKAGYSGNGRNQHFVVSFVVSIKKFYTNFDRICQEKGSIGLFFLHQAPGICHKLILAGYFSSYTTRKRFPKGDDLSKLGIYGRIKKPPSAAKGLPFGGWSLSEKGVILMVTYEALFAFCLVIIGVISLLQNKK